MYLSDFQKHCAGLGKLQFSLPENELQRKTEDCLYLFSITSSLKKAEKSGHFLGTEDKQENMTMSFSIFEEVKLKTDSKTILNKMMKKAPQFRYKIGYINPTQRLNNYGTKLQKTTFPSR